MGAREKRDISVSKLNVDLENFRIGEYDTSREAYKAMIKEQGENLLNLAEDIIENGLSDERFYVMPDPEEKGNFIVLEGNRRLTVLKILETPKLAVDTEFADDFSKLSKRYRDPIKMVECVVFPDKQSAFLWIERKHVTLGGRGISEWNAQAKARAEAFRGKVRPSKAVLDLLRTKNLMTDALEESLRRRTTNVDRVFQMPYLRKTLGIILGKDGSVTFENGKEGAGTQLILKMIKTLAEKKFNVNNIRSKEQRKDFINNFASGAVTVGNSPSGSGPSNSQKPGRKQSTLERKYLAMKGRAYALAIEEPRLNRLYIEALSLPAKKLTNSGGILTRVFLELSSELYLIKFKIPLPEKHVKKDRTKWSDFGITLKDKIQTVLEHIDPVNKDKELNNARRGLSSDEFIHSVTTLHDYIHDLNADPDPIEVKRTWERWQPYFSKLFEALKNKKEKG